MSRTVADILFGTLEKIDRQGEHKGGHPRHDQRVTAPRDAPVMKELVCDDRIGWLTTRHDDGRNAVNVGRRENHG